MSRRYLLGLGSNEQAEQRLVAMIEALLAEFGALWVSPVCRTRAVGGDFQDYLNGVVSFESSRRLSSIVLSCKAIEDDLGRVRPSPVCAADIDILACWDAAAVMPSQEVVTESYLQPQTDVLLAVLGEGEQTLRCSFAGAGACVETVALTRSNGQVLGIQPLLLRS